MCCEPEIVLFDIIQNNFRLAKHTNCGNQQTISFHKIDLNNKIIVRSHKHQPVAVRETTNF